MLHLTRLVKAVCPGGEQARAVQVFTEEWWARGAGREAALLVVWAAREAGAARLAWMEVWRGAGGANTSACEHACGALGACMAGALVCDGRADCPGGADELGACGAGARLLAALGAGGAGAAGALGGAAGAGALLLLAALALRRRRARGKLPAGRRLTEELLYDASRASSVAS